jgi:hypothetical protein
MNAWLIAPEDPAWVEVLRSEPHDFYHLPAYTALEATREDGDPRALLVESGRARLLLPLIVRGMTGGDVDATSPYGHPGPLVTGTDDAGWASEALEAGIERLRELGVISLFVRLHPLLNARPIEGVGTLVRHGDTVAIDLSLSAEELWQQTRRNHRQQIRQAREAGYTVREDQAWERAPEFRAIYRATMDRLGASDCYRFDDEYFDALRSALGDRLHLAVVEIDGRVAAAMLFAETAGIVVTHLSGSDERDDRHQPTKLIYDFVRTWGRERGDRWMQIGGGCGGADDSLMHFKCGFSPLRFPFHTLRVIVRPDAYARLTSSLGCGASSAGEAIGYFPAYRRPVGEAGPGSRPAVLQGVGS